MNEKRRNWNLFVGITLLGLTAWAASTSAASPTEAGTLVGSPACQEKVKARMAEIQTRSGKAPGAEAEQRLIASCSEAQLGVDFDELFASKAQNPDKEGKCRNSIRFARNHGLETSGRSDEELLSVCEGLPSDHEASCGFPTVTGEYYVIEDQRCVTRTGGVVQNVMAKAEKRVPRHDSPGVIVDDGGSDSGQSGSGTAQ